ncbi:protein NCBP2AS2 homolog [Mya arenaria]|uniref:protein NCBP2AS2 homolog n=1 Tax=Mya arenaria TaxID=6604 RepID=UPI0022E47BD3|nr:protein NCBP2AS2 homolog [Mya arenaria]
MPWRRFFGAFMNDPRIIQKLADSWPMRRAAKSAVSMYLRGKNHFKDAVDQSKMKSGANTSIGRFTSTFSEEVKKGMKDVSKPQGTIKGTRTSKRQGKR